MKTALAVGMTILLASTVALRADDPATDPSSDQATTLPATEPTTEPTTEPATTRPAEKSTSATSRPATKPTATGRRSPEAKASEDAIRAAIPVLTKEAQTAIRNKSAMPRSEPDYFKEKSITLEQDSLLAAITRSMGSDPRIDAYIKLQLLSGVEKFDAAHANAAIKAFVSAPALVTLPGVGEKENQLWDRKAMNAKKEDLGKINDELRTQRESVDAINVPMINYRNAFKDKITTDETTKMRFYEACVEELSQRAAAGYDTFTQWKDLATHIQSWGATATKKELVAMVAFLNEYAKRSPPSVYKELRWSSPGARTQKAHWYDVPASLNEKRMGALIDALKTAQTNAL